MGKMEQRIRELLGANPQYTPSQLAHRANYSLKNVRNLLAHMQAENAGAEEREEGPEKPAPRQREQRPLTQEVRQRLEEAEQRLIEQGSSVTRDRHAHEAHIGYHMVSAFLREKKACTLSQA